MFASITDYFIPAGFAGSLDLRRVRIIVNTVLLTGLFSLNFMLLCWWGNLLPGLYVLLFGYRTGWYPRVMLGYAFVFVGYLTVAVNSA